MLQQREAVIGLVEAVRQDVCSLVCCRWNVRTDLQLMGSVLAVMFKSGMSIRLHSLCASSGLHFFPQGTPIATKRTASGVCLPPFPRVLVCPGHVKNFFRENSQKIDKNFDVVFPRLLVVFSQRNSSKTLQKTFYKKIVSKSFYKKIDKKSQTDFF
jgi:hypothetical protein